MRLLRSLVLAPPRQQSAGQADRGAAGRRAADIGPLSGVDAALLVRAFEVARMGTIAAHAELDIETMPAVVWCKECEIETPVAANALLCGRCGTWQVELRSGAELLLKRVELSGNAQPLAAAG